MSRPLNEMHRVFAPRVKVLEVDYGTVGGA